MSVSTELRFYRTPEGVVWAPGPGSYAFWQRYLRVFDSVRVLARVGDVQKPPRGYVRGDGDRVSFAPLPHYVGASEFCRRFGALLDATRGSALSDDAVILRVPSVVAHFLVLALVRTGHPYAVEVVGDAWQSGSPGTTDHPLRPIFRLLLTWAQVLHVGNAAAAAYVTKRTLQRRYPCGSEFGVSDAEIAAVTGRPLVTTYSSIEIARSVIETSPHTTEQRRQRVITVASLEQPYKGVDYLIDAISRCVSRGLDVELVVVGDGRFRQSLETRAKQVGVADRVAFRGWVPSEVVLAELDCSDLFVLASLTEGLPRAMIEAMARGVPCIGTAVGGIPELLPDQVLVPPRSSRALAEKIESVLGSAGMAERLVAHGRLIAMQYTAEVLEPRRTAFYRHVKRITAHWLAARGAR